MSENKKNKQYKIVNQHYHINMKEEKPKMHISGNQWFQVLTFCVFFLVFVGLAWALTQNREIPSFSSLIDLIRLTPSVDVEYFVVTDNMFSWIKTLPLNFQFEGILEPLNFLNIGVNWINSTILGLKGFLQWLLRPLDIISWLGASIIQLISFVFTFVGWLLGISF